MGLQNGISIGIRKKHIRIENKFDCVEGVTPVAGSIFQPLSLTQKSGSGFSDEILRSALLDIQPTFKFPVEWIHEA